VAGGVDLDLPGDGVRLRATRWPGEGPAVLLLHGLASTRHIWDLVVPHLVGRGPASPAVVAVDQRGHGDSDRPAGPYTGAAAVADLRTALDAVGLSRVVVVGHSWGATTALRLAAEAPGRVLGVVCIDAGLPWHARTGLDRAALRERLTPPRLALPEDELRAVLRDGPLAPWWSAAVEDSVLPVFAVGADGLARARLPFDAHMAVVDDLLDGGTDALLDAVRCPAWLVACLPDGLPGSDLAAGKGDALAAAAARLARPRALTWGGAVHDVPLQWPGLVAGLVRAARDEAVTPALTGEGRRP
jgi:pimeloyl-ACP methyl ester carboxylesterase